MSPLEMQILQQIAQLQSSIGKNTPLASPETLTVPSIVSNSSLSEEDVRRIAKQVLVDEINALKDSAQTVPVEEVQDISPTMTAVTKALTEDERTWLLQADNLPQVEASIPDFLNTEDGILAIQSFYLYYRGLYGN